MQKIDQTKWAEAKLRGETTPEFKRFLEGIIRDNQHYCSSECPESKVYTDHEYQLKEMQRKIRANKK